MNTTIEIIIRISFILILIVALQVCLWVTIALIGSMVKKYLMPVSRSSKIVLYSGGCILGYLIFLLVSAPLSDLIDAQIKTLSSLLNG